MWSTMALLAAMVTSPSVEPTDTAARRVAEAYGAALRDGNLAGLQSAFAADGRFLSKGRDGGLRSQAFSEVLPGWLGGADPVVKLFVDRVEAPSENLASVTARLRMKTVCFQDQLLIMRLEPGWRIVAKTTERLPCSALEER